MARMILRCKLFGPGRRLGMRWIVADCGRRITSPYRRDLADRGRRDAVQAWLDAYWPKDGYQPDEELYSDDAVCYYYTLRPKEPGA